MKQPFYFLLMASLLLFSCQSEQGKKGTTKYSTQSGTDANGYTYEYVENDPMNVRIYTLENGLKVYLTVNKDAPRIQTLIPIKAGSTYDPKDNTGLAHYLEHMVFKGTERLGTVSWEKEAPLLELIAEKYEEHKATNDPEEKKRIYAQIDSISQEASKYAVANEYDKMVSELGAKGTNAFTSNEKTVYINDIPTTELERWVRLERERFGSLVLRLFHTELEAVYEEFNIGQDNDNRKLFFTILENLFPTHPYGQQTTIGTSEHLKNPSMRKIQEYWETYYVPNNMAICLSGDLNFEETIKIIDQYWGDLKPSEKLPEHSFPKEEPITAPIEMEVYGPDKEAVALVFRTEGLNSKEYMMADIISSMLSNGQAGLFDIELKQKQKALRPAAFVMGMKEYSAFFMQASPVEGTTLEETKELLLAELDKIRKGEFEDWMLPAIINNYQLSEMRQLESNYRAYAMMEAFTNEMPWEDAVSYLSRMDEITKEEVVAYANKTFDNNYVTVYKRTGTDSTVAKVEKPQITPVSVNRDSISSFYADFQTWPTASLEPAFINYDEKIEKSSLKSDVEFAYIKNNSNELAKVIYVIDMGKNHDLDMALAVSYLDYLGTSKYSAEEIQQEFYKLGLKKGVNVGANRSYIYVDGLEKNMDEGLQLLEHLLADAQPDTAAYERFVQGILKERANKKLDKGSILQGAMNSYARYGDNSPYKHILAENELLQKDPASLTNKIHQLFDYKHRVFYYGTQSIDQAKELVTAHHAIKDELKEYPAPTEFTIRTPEKNEIFVVDHDMVQAEILLVANEGDFDPALMPSVQLFNEYFGGGMGSVVFQEIREAKGLAYSTYAAYGTPSTADKPYYIIGYLGTQGDKMNGALNELLNLMNDMPISEGKLTQAKMAIRSKIESERIIKDQVYFNWLSNQDRGIDHDYRKDVYNFAGDATMNDLTGFFNEYVKGSNYSIMVLGNIEMLDIEGLKKFGNVTELTKEQVFGY